jgi:hypothetical protein
MATAKSAKMERILIFGSRNLKPSNHAMPLLALSTEKSFSALAFSAAWRLVSERG